VVRPEPGQSYAAALREAPRKVAARRKQEAALDGACRKGGVLQAGAAVVVGLPERWELRCW